MTCTIHPGSAAVGTCVSCGRGVCDTCSIRFNNMVHCRECVEAGLVRGGRPQQQAPPPMAPPGMPPMGMQQPMVMHPAYARLFGYIEPVPSPGASPVWFKAGAFMFAFMAVFSFIVTGYMMFMILPIHYAFESSDNTGDVMTTLVFFYHFPCYFLAPAFLGIQKNYGVRSSGAAFIGFMALNSLSMFLWSQLYLDLSEGGTNRIYSVAPIIAPVLFGLGVIFLTFPMKGALFHMPPMHPGRRSMGWSQRGLLVAGILFACWIGLYVFGWIALGIAFMIGVRAFLKAPMPGETHANPMGPFPQPAPAFQPSPQVPPPRY